MYRSGFNARAITCALLAATALHAADSDTVNIRGRISDPAGQGIAGATVRLVGQGLSTVSGADGSYALTGAVPVTTRTPQAAAQSGVRIDKGMLRFFVDRDRTPVRIVLYGLNGQSRRVNAPTLCDRGEQHIPLPHANTGAGISCLQLDRAGSSERYTLVRLDDRITLQPSNPDGEGPRGLLRSGTAAVDSLLVSTATHVRARVAVSGFSATVNVTLRPQVRDPDLDYSVYTPAATDVVISRTDYLERLHGFWLGQSIANWTGLITEMDKIGSIGTPTTGAFYTDADWGKNNGGIWEKPREPIGYKFTFEGTPWGADDDTDLEYLYQHLLDQHNTSRLSGTQIREGWLEHIHEKEENYLWVSNQRAFDLMGEGMLPPATSLPENNEHYEMIDAQLSTEIFGLFAPARPDIARSIASLPVRTTAYGPAEQIAQFYVTMHSLASRVDRSLSMKEQVFWIAHEARRQLPDSDYPAKMFDFVWERYRSGTQSWESVRDDLYQRYQVNHPQDGYDLGYYTARNPWCNACFAAGINFAAGMVSLFFGEGDLPQTIRIAVLAGWDSDNPAATWGGLLGFMVGKTGVEEAFAPFTNGRRLSDTFWIHRTRKNFPDRTPDHEGEDSFPLMAQRGVLITDRVVIEEMGGGADPRDDVWYIPAPGR